MRQVSDLVSCRSGSLANAPYPPPTHCHLLFCLFVVFLFVCFFLVVLVVVCFVFVLLLLFACLFCCLLFVCFIAVVLAVFCCCCCFLLLVVVVFGERGEVMFLCVLLLLLLLFCVSGFDVVFGLFRGLTDECSKCARNRRRKYTLKVAAVYAL